ncbi:Sedlin, N-terminal conserved region family protein [Leishmania donovani]|uniref:Sedlin, N-terminal conserved region family protein n=1 Tax=Leishmania donovani TaxID=5661 RepID=A0A504XUU8_LEIDO|nr:Sedlin, N-terminal conserved region family protein [Leishmania donovani]
MPFMQFLVVGPSDACLFAYGGSGTNISGSSDNELAHYFSLYSALDVIDEAMWTRGDFLLSRVDRPYGDSYYISAYVGLAPVRLLLMQDSEPKDSLSTFFSEAYHLCVRYFMNPFSTTCKKIQSTTFRDEMTLLCRKYC